MIVVDIDTFPDDAHAWGEVDHLVLGRAIRPQDRIFPGLDIRRTAWEWYQDVREFPVELEGGVTIA